ncbi:MAG: response regulator, partial [Gemmatimonadaceae bacterium]
AMVYGIVKQSGGYLWVDSVPRSGSAFTVYLPSEKAKTGSWGPKRSGTPESSAGETILVVDDEEVLRRIAARVLTAAGYRVRVAGDADEALRLARADGPRIDLLLTDIVMPGMNGRELAAVLRSEQPGVRVLLMSGYSHGHGSSHGTHEETQFLQKPFTIDELLAKVRGLLPAANVPR